MVSTFGGESIPRWCLMACVDVCRRLDWQQGNISKRPGVDPLWVLNHFHFWDSGRKGQRPMTFTRYGGPGGHRYPIGFSGVSQ